ncbi:MAG: phosphoadenosine phosphosulfate reductase, partial [Candidatus Methanoperedens sp.]
MKDTKHFDIEPNFIFWCNKCNVPLLDSECGICHEKGARIDLTQPGDVRFASPHEYSIIDELILQSFGASPLSGKLILLNKIPGEDKTDEIIVDGLRFGVLRFDLLELAFRLDLMLDGAQALIESGILKKLVKISSKGGHLSGKTIDGGEVLECPDDIRKGDTILIIARNLSGLGVSYRDSSKLKNTGQSIKIRK